MKDPRNRACWPCIHKPLRFRKPCINCEWPEPEGWPEKKSRMPTHWDPGGRILVADERRGWRAWADQGAAWPTGARGDCKARMEMR